MTALTMPGRSLEQRMVALARANDIRSYRASLKRDLTAGTIQWTDLLDDPMCRTMKVWDVLICLPKLGRVKVNRALRHCAISPSKTLGGLTYRQRDELAEYLG